MEEMNKQQFESMLGTESVDRTNYIDLLEHTKMHINSSAVVGMMLMKITEGAEDMIKQLGAKDGAETIQKILRIITSIHMMLAKDLAQEHVMKHHSHLYGTEVTVEDFLQDNSIDNVRVHMHKIIGFDVMEMMDAWDDSSDKGKE
jgi:pyruvate formate-lyase activating enzyme-like uncharacterized protein